MNNTTIISVKYPRKTRPNKSHNNHRDEEKFSALRKPNRRFFTGRRKNCIQYHVRHLAFPYEHVPLSKIRRNPGVRRNESMRNVVKTHNSLWSLLSHSQLDSWINMGTLHVPQCYSVTNYGWALRNLTLSQGEWPSTSNLSSPFFQQHTEGEKQKEAATSQPSRQRNQTWFLLATYFTTSALVVPMLKWL